jgi:hypothetical protein
MVVLATHTPLTSVLPGPQAKATCVIMPSGWEIGASVIACTDVATEKAKAATAINLIIRSFLLLSNLFNLPTQRGAPGDPLTRGS